jgi:AP-2 complex subunit alpha
MSGMLGINTGGIGIMQNQQARGLHNFIRDLRLLKNKEEETMRVDKELANIRQKFVGSSTLTSYNKKK